MLFLVLIWSCEEPAEPIAEFSTSKESYRTGELIRATNESMNASSYEWVVRYPDGSSRSFFGKDMTTSSSSAGFLKITLIAKGDGGKNEISHTVTVNKPVSDPNPNPGSGTMTMWSTISSQKRVFIDDVEKGTFTCWFTQNNAPQNCGVTNCFNFTAQEGFYRFRVLDAQFIWEGTFKITGGECSTIALIE